MPFTRSPARYPQRAEKWLGTFKGSDPLNGTAHALHSVNKSFVGHDKSSNLLFRNLSSSDVNRTINTNQR